jgi:sulfhydrogenase subunit beta (sulfur reductase)
MNVLLLKKTDLPSFLETLAKTRLLIAPLEDRTGSSFGPVEDVTAVRLDYRNTSLSAKATVFPQTETLLTFRNGEGEEWTPETPETVLFGVRPCDARSLTMLDKVFRWDGLDDPYYVKRREKTTVVALACNEPGPTCFCTSVGGSPADETGADLLATDLGDALLLRSVTPRGDALLQDAGDTVQPADSTALETAKSLATQAEARLAPVRIPDNARHLAELFEADVWTDLSFGCLGCGACTYSCPTCHCFDITDEQKKGAGQRVRSWDTCTFPLFTQHASGHNPRTAKHARLRQRILHKFSYCPENFGEAFCVGCGRCVVSCPSGLDIREILERLDQTVSAAKKAA